MKKLAVVAFGGNALLRGDQQGTIDEQEANALMTSERLLTLIKRDYDLVITHGNGPQVGNIILANSAGAKLHVSCAQIWKELYLCQSRESEQGLP